MAHLPNAKRMPSMQTVPFSTLHILFKGKVFNLLCFFCLWKVSQTLVVGENSLIAFTISIRFSKLFVTNFGFLFFFQLSSQKYRLETDCKSKVVKPNPWRIHSELLLIMTWTIITLNCWVCQSSLRKVLNYLNNFLNFYLTLWTDFGTLCYIIRITLEQVSRAILFYLMIRHAAADIFLALIVNLVARDERISS